MLSIYNTVLLTNSMAIERLACCEEEDEGFHRYLHLGGKAWRLKALLTFSIDSTMSGRIKIIEIIHIYI